MSAGELALVVGAVLCAVVFAGFAVTLVRVRDLVGQLRDEVTALRAATARAEAVTRDALAEARVDLERFDKLLGSAESLSAALGRSNRVARTALSSPAIKAAGIATGTSRAVKKLRGHA